MEKTEENKELKLLAVELMDLKFNKGGHESLCNYIEKCLVKDGVKVCLDKVKQTGKFNDILMDYSMKSKREGIKEMTAEIITSGEERGLNGYTKLGVWLNHSVEVIGLRMTEKLMEDVDKMVNRRLGSVWEIYCRQEDQKMMKNNAVDVFAMSKMWERAIKNIKQIKYDNFLRFNKYVW